MKQEDEEFSKRAAEIIGESVETTSGFILDQIEDLSLWFLEQIAESHPKSEGVTQLSQIVHSMRKVTAHVPELTGRLAVGTTFIGLRLSIKTIKMARKIFDE